MSLSQLARSICESPTLKLNETAALLREKGEPVIHLGGGEPKSKAPIDAIVNCAALLNTGRRQVHARRTASPPSRRPSSATPRSTTAGRRARQRHRLQRRQAGHHGGAHAILDPQGRGHLPGAVLGELPGDGQARRRRSGRRSRPRTAASSPRSQDIADAVGSVHQGHHPQQPEQPVGRGLLRRVHRRTWCEFCEKKRPLADHGRHLQPADLRRPRAHQSATSSPRT